MVTSLLFPQAVLDTLFTKMRLNLANITLVHLFQIILHTHFNFAVLNVLVHRLHAKINQKIGLNGFRFLRKLHCKWQVTLNCNNWHFGKQLEHNN